jgi:hypothetical protein
MNTAVRKLRNFFVSLKLTVVLLVLSMILIFAGTLAQVDLGIWVVQSQFFHSFLAIWHVGPLYVPLPGGYLIGGLLLVNLIAAHVYRFKLTWKKSGIFLTHLGIILLLLGELVSGLMQEEFQMRLSEGETKNYAESYRHNELAIIETTDPKFDDVVVIPEKMLEHGREVQHPKLPFRVVIRDYFANAALQIRANMKDAPPQPANAGVGPKLVATAVPETFKQDDRNWPAAFVEFIGPKGSLGTYLVSTQLATSQTLEFEGRSWRVGLRFQRNYQPFSLTLNKVRHDVYVGTDIPKNFSSDVELKTADGHEDRNVLIYMNNPLRHGGLTFFQYQMDSEHASSVLQVVRNPGWLMPYVSCIMIVLGLVVQFGIHLASFIGRRREPLPA